MREKRQERKKGTERLIIHKHLRESDKSESKNEMVHKYFKE